MNTVKNLSACCLAAGSLILWNACGNSTPPEKKDGVSAAVTGASVLSSCPYLTRDGKGRPVLSWVQQDSAGGTAAVYYAVSADSGRTFGTPRLIPGTRGVEPHGENMPKLVFRGNGNILAMFGVKAPHPGNPYTGAVFYTRSPDRGATWTAARPLSTDPDSYDQRYFDIALLPGDAVGAVWLNNSRPEGSTVYFAKAPPHRGFEKGRIIGRHSCQCCRTDLLTDNTGLLHVAFRDIIADSIRDMVTCFSRDTGKTFSAPVRISADNWVIDGCPHTGPSMAVNQTGLHFAWYTMGGGGGVYYCHAAGGDVFSPREAVSAGASARHPQMSALPDGNLLIVWDESIEQDGIYNSRIGFQERSKNGLVLRTSFITPARADAVFPQVMALNNGKALVAYTQRKGSFLQVRYQMVDCQ